MVTLVWFVLSSHVLLETSWPISRFTRSAGGKRKLNVWYKISWILQQHRNQHVNAESAKVRVMLKLHGSIDINYIVSGQNYRLLTDVTAIQRLEPASLVQGFS